MITNQQTRNIVDTIGAEQMKYTVSDGNISKLIQQAVCAYKNPMKSVIREYVVNARDAMVLNNITKPIEVSTPSALTPVLKIRDYAGGLTEEETKQLLFSFGASGEHKQTSNRYVGGFGIGSKSAFNLSDSFLYTVYKDGKETVWSCKLNNESFPTAAKLYDRATKEENGVLVTIPCNDTSNCHKIALEVLGWLDVPVLLDGELVQPVIASKFMSGAGITHRTKTGFKWSWLPKCKSSGHYADVVFVVGCGDLHLPDYGGPSELRKIEQRLEWRVNGRLVIELPVGSVSLMTSREDFIYDKRTIKILQNVLAEVYVQIMQQCREYMLKQKSSEDMLQAMALMHRITKNNNMVFPDSVNKALRDKFDMGWFMRKVNRKIHSNDHLDRIYVARYEHSRRSRHWVLSENAKGNGHWNHYCSDFSVAKDGKWGDDFQNRLDQLSANGTDKEALVWIEEIPFLKETESAIKLQALSWDNMMIRIYPRLARGFKKDVKSWLDYKCKLENNEAGAVLVLIGDEEKLLPEMQKKFPGAKVEVADHLPKFKQKPGTNETKERVVAFPMAGWLASLEKNSIPKNLDLTNPNEIPKLLDYNIFLAINRKTSLRELYRCKKPILLHEIGYNDPPDKNSETLKADIKTLIIRALMCGADVKKEANGLPVVVIVKHASDVRHLDATFLDSYGLFRKYKTHDLEQWEYTQMALWWKRWFDKWTRDTGSYYRSEGRLKNTATRYLSGVPKYLDELSDLIPILLSKLEAKRISDKEAVKNIRILKRLYETPKEFVPLTVIDYGADCLDDTGESSQAFVKLFLRTPALELLFRELSKINGSLYNTEKYINDIILLVTDSIRKKGDKKNDNV